LDWTIVMRIFHLIVICLVGLQACAPVRTTRTAYLPNIEDAMRISGGCEFGVLTAAGRDYGDLQLFVRITGNSIRKSVYQPDYVDVNNGNGIAVRFTLMDRRHSSPGTLNLGELRIQAGNRIFAPVGVRTYYSEAYFDFEPGAYKNITVLFRPGAALIDGKPLEIDPIRFEYRTESKVAISAVNC
jgi:hypothetical protein